jgi:hypothetical protein
MPDPTYTLSECGKKLIETKTDAVELPVANLKERKTMLDARIVQLQAEADALAAKIATAEGLGYTEE